MFISVSLFTSLTHKSLVLPTICDSWAWKSQKIMITEVKFFYSISERGFANRFLRMSRCIISSLEPFNSQPSDHFKLSDRAASVPVHFKPEIIYGHRFDVFSRFILLFVCISALLSLDSRQSKCSINIDTCLIQKRVNALR